MGCLVLEKLETGRELQELFHQGFCLKEEEESFAEVKVSRTVKLRKICLMKVNEPGLYKVIQGGGGGEERERAEFLSK